jgi:hypothetical protein
MKAEVEIPEHPIFDENTVGMASHEASHSVYKQIFMALFVKKKLRQTARLTNTSVSSHSKRIHSGSDNSPGVPQEKS